MERKRSRSRGAQRGLGRRGGDGPSCHGGKGRVLTRLMIQVTRVRLPQPPNVPLKVLMLTREVIERDKEDRISSADPQLTSIRDRRMHQKLQASSAPQSRRLRQLEPAAPHLSHPFAVLHAVQLDVRTHSHSEQRGARVCKSVRLPRPVDHTPLHGPPVTRGSMSRLVRAARDATRRVRRAYRESGAPTLRRCMLQLCRYMVWCLHVTEHVPRQLR